MSENTMLGLRFTFEKNAPTMDTLEYKDIRKGVEKVISYFFETSRTPITISFNVFEHTLQHLYVYFPKYIIDTNIHFEQFIFQLKQEVRELNLFEDRPLYKEGWFEVIMVFNPQPHEEDLTIEMIEEAKNKPVSHNNFQVLRDPLEFYLSFFHVNPSSREATDINNRFEKNILYICAAYQNYNEKSRTPANFYDWKEIVRASGTQVPHNDRELSTMFERARKFAYTVVTLHIIVSSFGENEKRIVEQYRDDLLDFMIRRVFAGERRSIYDAFALFLRDEVFFMDTKIHWFLKGYCSNDKSLSLDPRVAEFVRRIERVYDQYIRLKKYKLEDEMKDEELPKIKADILKDFDIVKKRKLINDIIETKLDVRRKNGVETYGIAYRDGLVMAQGKKLIIRPTLMEDQILNCGQASIYSPEQFSMEHPYIVDILTCFRQIFVDEENVQWFLRWLASLHAKKPERCLLILHGEGGGNAKTTIAKILSRLLGKYFLQANEGLLYEDPSSSCSPYSAQLEEKVLVCFSEPNMKKQIPANVIKSMTGGDPKTAAAKYKDATTFDQTAKVIMLCNIVPSFDGIDPALLDRVYMMPCIGRYMPDAPLDPEEQKRRHVYPRNDDFWTREGIVDGLLWLMLRYWDDYVEKGLKQTQSQFQATLQWKKQSCFAARFISDFVSYGEGGATLFDVKQVYDEFNDYRVRSNIKEPFSEREFVAVLKSMMKVEQREVCFQDPVTRADKREVREVVNIVLKDTRNKVAGTILSIVTLPVITNNEQRDVPHD